MRLHSHGRPLLATELAGQEGQLGMRHCAASVIEIAHEISLALHANERVTVC